MTIHSPHSRTAASIAAMSIFRIVIIAANAHPAAAFRPHTYRLFIDGELASEYSG